MSHGATINARRKDTLIEFAGYFRDGNNKPYRNVIWGRRCRSAGCHAARRDNRDHAYCPSGSRLAATLTCRQPAHEARRLASDKSRRRESRRSAARPRTAKAAYRGAADDERRAGAARRIDRRVGHGNAHEMNERQAQADRQRRKTRRRLAVCRAHDRGSCVQFFALQFCSFWLVALAANRSEPVNPLNKPR